MNKAEFSQLMKEISVSYGEKKFPLSNDIMDIWFKYFEECVYELLLEVIENHIKKNNFPPAISDLYQEYRSLKRERDKEKAEEEEEEELVGEWDDW